MGSSLFVMSVFGELAMLLLILLYEISSVCQESPTDNAVWHGQWVMQSAESFKASLCCVVWVCLLPLWAHWESVLWLGSRGRMLLLLLGAAIAVVSLLLILLMLLFQSDFGVQSQFVCVGAVAMAALCVVSFQIISDTWCGESDMLRGAFHLSIAISLFCLHCFLRTVNREGRAGRGPPPFAVVLLAEPANRAPLPQ